MRKLILDKERNHTFKRDLKIWCYYGFQLLVLVTQSPLCHWGPCVWGPALWHQTQDSQQGAELEASHWLVAGGGTSTVDHSSKEWSSR